MSKKKSILPKMVVTQPTGWRDVAFLCRKCGKKLDGGFGPDGKQSLRRALRDRMRAEGRRGELGILEIGCLGICPKGAITMGLASAPGEVLIVAAGADIAALLDRRPSAMPKAL
jgi:predicted metal-binding protein